MYPYAALNSGIILMQLTVFLHKQAITETPVESQGRFVKLNMSTNMGIWVIPATQKVGILCSSLGSRIFFFRHMLKYIKLAVIADDFNFV